MSSARGFGAPLRSNRNSGGGGGGGVLTLDNGLTLTGTNGQLGGLLLAPTLIDLNTFPLQLMNAGLDFGVDINEGFGTVALKGGLLSGSGVEIDNSNLTRLGDIYSQGNGTAMSIDDFLQAVTIQSGLGGMPGLFLDFANSLFQFGDVNTVVNSSILTIDDGNQIVHLQANTNHTLDMNAVADTIILSNISSSLTISGGAISMAVVGGGAVTLDSSLPLGQFSVDVNGGGNQIVFDPTTDTFIYGSGGGGAGNSNRMQIDSAADTIEFTNNSSNVGLLINGVAGFTGTVAAPATITVNNGIVTNVA